MIQTLRRTAATLLIGLLLSSCTSPALPPDEVKQEPGPAVAAPASPSSHTPHLLLDLALGDDPQQPGWTPERVGGIPASGPRDLLVDDQGTTVTLLDQAKGRLLHYQDEKLVGSVALPWLYDEAGDLRRTGTGGYTVTSRIYDIMIDEDGRILDIRPAPAGIRDETLAGKAEAVTIGTDRYGNRYEREPAEPGFLVRRIGTEGQELARGTSPTDSWVIDWHVNESGGVYVLTAPTAAPLDRAQVQMLLPPVGGEGQAPSAATPEPPVFLGRPLPERIRLTGGNGLPVDVTGEVDRWNIWKLLGRAQPSQVPVPHDLVPTRLTAFFADGEPLQIDLYGDQVALGGQVYAVGSELDRLADALRLSPAALAQALGAATSAQVALEDLTGAARDLSPAEREELKALLARATPVAPEAAPQPLEPEFPRYGIRLSGEGWSAGIILSGEHHLIQTHGGALAVAGPLGETLRGWLPIPELSADDPASLFLAEKLEIAPGNDLTRWKNSVVRMLVGVTRPQESPFSQPLTLIFTVDGERRMVLIDETGFTYAGQRYERPRLLSITGFQSVP